MRTSKTVTKKIGGAAGQIFLAAAIAGAGVAATTSSVSFQDITSLTNTRTSDENRWLAHLVSVPTGSDHAMMPVAAKGDKTAPKQSPVKLHHVMGVQTQEALHVLDATHVGETGETAHINRAAKGDRVFKPEPTREQRVAKKMIVVDPIVTGSLSRMVAAQNFTFKHMPRVAKAQPAKKKPAQLNIMATLAGPNETVTKDVETSTKGRVVLPRGQMVQARSAAREMAKVVKKVKAETTLVAANPAIRSTTSSYALAVDNAPTQMASAFAAVLRPAIKDAKKKRSGTLIRLAPGDHKWAANPLPKKSFSRAQRRCLAAGIYFEARGESTKGQQAVAQVILNRVKNPAYPGSICGVVYQNKRKRNACQFSFACDGIRDKVSSRKHWTQSVKVANDAIEGRFWLRSVGSSSHYHADYVWPRWRKKMRKMVKIGRHIFYRTYGGGWS